MEHQLLRRADLDDLAVLHDGDAIGEPDRLVEIMGDEDDRLLEHALQAHEFRLHLAADQRIERRKRLVEEPDFGLDRQRAGNAHPLLLAAGKFARIMVFAAVEADELDHLLRALCLLRLGDALDHQREGDIFEDGQMRQQGEMLEHHAHLVAADLDELGFACLQQVAAVEGDSAIGRLDQARQASHQRRLARSRQAHDDEDLALMDIDIGAAHRADQLCLGQGLRRCSPLCRRMNSSAA